MGLSTHILDTNLGRPASGVAVSLEEQSGPSWLPIGRDHTDADGRCRTLLGERALESKTYRLTFFTRPYFAAQQLCALYPYVEITFDVADPASHHHIPLLIAANGYSTYRGS